LFTAAVMFATCLSSTTSSLPADAPLAEPTQSVSTFLERDPEVAPLWRALEGEAIHARIWYWGWSGFFGAVVLGETVAAATTDSRGTRINAYVNIAASGAGMLAVLLRPPPAAYGLDAIRAMPEATEAERAAKVRALRDLFDRAASEERFYRSPLNHLIGLGVNAGIAAFLYFGYKLGGRALVTLLAGSAIWEAQVWTHPTAARDRADALPSGPGPQAHWIFLGNGVGLAGSF
jgi:hypothetical protein